MAAALGFSQPVEIRMMGGAAYGIPPKETTNTTTAIRRAVFDEFHRQNPDISVVNAGGLNLVGDQADNMFLMSMAGDKAPDIFYVNFRQYYTFLEQKFCRPLDDLVARDPDVLGRTNPTILDVVKSYDGHIYAIPFFQVALGLYYRKDYFLEAGLDPAKPPKTWDEFYQVARKLTDEKKGRYGFVFSTPPGYLWSNFLYQSGSDVVRRDAAGNWMSAIDNDKAVAAVDFFRRLVLPEKVPGGKDLPPVANIAKSMNDDIRMGKTAMWFGYTNDVLMSSSTTYDLDSSVIGIAAMPAGPAGFQNEINAGMWAINARVKDPKKIEACWRFIKFFAGQQAAKVNTDKCVEMGLGQLVNPIWLEKFGYQDILATVDPGYVEANKTLFSTGHPEPYGRNCQQVYSVLDNVLDKARLDPSTPAREVLKWGAAEMNQKLIGYTPESVMQQRRGFAAGILICAALVGLFFLARVIIRARLAPKSTVYERLPAGTPRSKIVRFVWFCVAPAALSILVWQYYPLLRGLTIAFQDYKIASDSKWVGIDNFVGVFSQPVFYQSLWNSFLYVGLSLIIGFFIPIALAIALNEIPVGRAFFRTLYYLPAMTSSIVIALLWRQLYDRAPTGILNSLLAPLIEHVINPVRGWFGGAPWPVANDWLGNPSLAIFAVVIPGIWAGAGPGSILYMAALKNVAEERYEAADLDGASWWQKIRYITLPALRPLILINLLGVFIAGFKAMENIFVLTQGGPVNSTRTIGLEVWQNAFMYLKFGYATAAAWVMGAILVGFTLIQIRSLLKMRFSSVKA
jgi:multiple sugar transport system permease protein